MGDWIITYINKLFEISGFFWLIITTVNLNAVRLYFESKSLEPEVFYSHRL